jgi:protein-S-isoprenylcysteine O-methyltransferase Ste14
MSGGTSQDGAEPQVGAAVRVPPPPLFYLVPFVVLWLVDLVWPLTIPGGTALRLVGWLLVVAGLALSVSGAATFRRHHTTVIPHHAVATLVDAGPYRFTRNPMYLGLTTAYLGAGLGVASWWPLFALPVVVAVISTQVIAKEEAYLRERFPKDYAAYAARTRRWI